MDKLTYPYQHDHEHPWFRSIQTLTDSIKPKKAWTTSGFDTMTPGWEKALKDVWSKTVRTFKAISDASALGSGLKVVGTREGGLS